MRNNTVLRVFRNLFRRMGTNALWYVGIFALVIILLRVIVMAPGVSTDIGKAVTLSQVADFSNKIYLLVLGIVYPLVYFRYYIETGVTRRQFSLGMFATAMLLSLCFAVSLVPLRIAEGTFTPVEILMNAVYGTLCFMTGWTSTVGFQFMRPVPIFVGILCAVSVLHGGLFLSKLSLPLWGYLSIAALAVCLLGFFLLRVVKRIALKC